MTTGLVIALPGDEARLKRKVRAHFKRLGFLKAPDVSDGVNPRLFDGEDAVFGFAGVQT